jgi:maltose alpha-D-glucosyltransferase/alpha-amylase
LGVDDGASQHQNRFIPFSGRGSEWGNFEVLSTRDPAIFAIRYDWRNNSVLFVHNLAAIPKEVSFSTGLRGKEGRMLVNLLSDDHSKSGDDGRHHLLLEAYGYR